MITNAVTDQRLFYRLTYRFATTKIGQRLHYQQNVCPKHFNHSKQSA